MVGKTGPLELLCSRRPPGEHNADRGMALASVLMVSVILLALAGAFFAAHKTDLALMVSAQDREYTKNGCLSVGQFLQYRLENDRFFARAPFSEKGREDPPHTFPEDSESPVLEVSYRGNGVDPRKNIISGRLLATDTEFEAVLLNNLDGPATVTNSLGGTPPRTARVWITTRRKNVTKKLDFIVKRSPFSNASIISGGNIDVSLTSSAEGAWWLGSRQPSGNAVRAKGKISGPEVLNENRLGIEFEPSEGLDGQQKAPYGVLQAQFLSLSLNGVRREVTADTPQLSTIQENIQGSLTPGSGDFQVPRLSSDELRSASYKFTLPNREYTFRSERHGDRVSHMLLGDGQLLQRYDAINSPEHEEQDPGDPGFPGVPGGEPGGGDIGDEYEPGRFLDLNAYGRPTVRFDLEARTMSINPDVEVQAEGNFVLRALNENGAPDMDGQPTLILGNEHGAATLAASGIQVEGSVGGQGALKAQEEGLSIRAKSSLSTTPDFGIALHSAGDVTLSRPARSSRDGLSVDWDAYKLAVEKTDRSTRGSLDAWMHLKSQTMVANDLSKAVLAAEGEMLDFDHIWDGLGREFDHGDDFALEKIQEWLQEAVEAEYEDDPSWIAPIPEPDPLTGDLPPVESPPQILLTPAIPAGGGLTLGRYIRLREYMRSLKRGEPDPSWLEADSGAVASQRNRDVIAMVSNQLSAYQLRSGQYSQDIDGVAVLRWSKLTDFLSGSNPFLAEYTPDMTFRGLVYAGGDFIFDTKNQGVQIEGALVAHGNVLIDNATGARFIYNGELLENLFATEEGDTSVKLERSFWTFY